MRITTLAPVPAAILVAVAPFAEVRAEHRGGPADARAVPRIACPIQIDGALDEPCWGEALALPLRYETRPGENVDPPTETVCRFGYDPTRLYVGCRADDPDPAQIRARLSDRDSAFNDDFVGVVLDTFNDERRAYEFFVNPLGVQMDLIMDEVGGSEDSSWDAIWQSSGRLTERGYEVEFAIPFSSLSFQRSEGAQIWGLDVVRMYPRNHRVRIGLNPMDRNVDCYLCQASKIVGFEGATPGNNLQLTPTLTVTRSDELAEFPSGDLQSGDTESDLGLTALWGVTPNLTLSGTLNPDFSQVEADVARLDINEEFALFYPEKRPFFLEGADFFDTPISAVYTRTVADPAWGAKVTGKEGRGAFGGYVAQDDRTNLLIPGKEGSDLDSLEESYLTGVFRYRRDVGQKSAVGALLTAREGDAYHNRVFGMDALLRPTEVDTIRVQLLGSQTLYPDRIVADHDQPAGEFSDRALRVSYWHGTRNWFANAVYYDFGKDFRADAGFVPRVDYRQVAAAGGYVWNGDGDRWFSRMELGTQWDQTEDQSGALIERELEGWWTYNGPLQSYVWIGAGQRDRVFNEVVFDQSFIGAYFEVTPVGDLALWVDAGYEDEVDFGYTPEVGVARQGQQLDLRPGLRYNFGRHLRANLSHSLRWLDLDQGRLFEARLTELRLVYQFNVRAFVRLITQYARVDRDPLLYDDEVAEHSEDLFSQLLFTYKVNPQTALYAGYTDQRATVGSLNDVLVVADDLTLTGRSFFFKIGYAWLP